MGKVGDLDPGDAARYVQNLKKPQFFLIDLAGKMAIVWQITNWLASYTTNKWS